MTRYEENKIVANEMSKRAEHKPTGTYEEMESGKFNLSQIMRKAARRSRRKGVLWEI